MKTYYWMVNLCLIFLAFGITQAEDASETLNQEYEAQKKAMYQQYEVERLNMEQKWAAVKTEQEEKWAQLKAEVERKWQTFVHSTRKDWVAYDPDKDTRSKVDFKQGKVVFEVIVPEDDPDAIEKVKTKIKKQADEVFRQKDIADKEILENQVLTREGEKVTPANLEDFIKKEVLSEITPAPQSFESKDGITRRRYKVEIDMIPNHLRVRAGKYLPEINSNAIRFNIKPELVLAVIHTESYFNPLALSSSNAVGMMQIIPRFAGREAYKKVYGVDQVLTHEYLYNPRNNIELGSAYLSLLMYTHFRDIQGDIKNRYISICGYNWGPTAMRKNIVNRYPISKMSDEQVYSLLRQKTPKETRNYIKRVIERMPLYGSF
ncbi:murein transglycosylase domain-containing protein [Thermodesulfobacteriota bacterium]